MSCKWIGTVLFGLNWVRKKFDWSYGGYNYELTGNLKKQVEKAETKDEKKSLIENAGMLLTDDELDQVAGGLWDGLWQLKESHFG